MVLGESGLFVGDVVTHLDDCEVNSVSDWISCLSASLQANRSAAYKLPSHNDYRTQYIKKPLDLSGKSSIVIRLAVWTVTDLRDFKVFIERRFIQFSCVDIQLVAHR